MDRRITSFIQDDEQHWVARLDCGHRQHVRDIPPLKDRPWTRSAEGRESHLGTALHCVRCDQFELPDDVVPYKRTADFTELTMPAGLREDHMTGPGVWARITVLEGRLRYRVPALGTDILLKPDNPGIVLPAVPHNVEPLGAVRFFVEFLRRDPTAS
jgi:tellurite resistance-related uncharacterized protein